MSANNGALAGLRVLDLTHALAGPFGTMILADLGADIAKVEHPDGGDRTRIQGRIGDFSAYFGSINRGKRGLLLDLKNPAGVEIAKRLAEKADVVTVNFTPGVVEKMGLDYATLSKINPRLIYAICSGYGQTGPWKDRQGTDPMIQATAGLMSVTGHPGGPPARVGYSMGDMGGGVFMVIGILSALYERQSSGKGQFIDIALLDCQVALMENPIVTYLATGKIAQPTGNRHPRELLTRIYPTADGNLMVGLSKRTWEIACRQVFDRPNWIDDPVFKASDDRKPGDAMLDDLVRSRPTRYWQEKLDKAGITCAEVNTVAQTVEEPQVIARQMIQETVDSNGQRLKVVASPIKLSRTPARIRAAAPQIGEHTEVVLREWLGVDDDELGRLASRGAFRRGESKKQWIW